MLDDANALDQTALRERVAALEAQLVAAKRESDAYRDERDRLREAYRHLQLELELQRRRLFVAKAERIDTAQLDLEFAATLAKLEEVAGRLAEDEAAPRDEPPPAGPKRRPTGRRTLRDLDLPEERIVVIDPLLRPDKTYPGASPSPRVNNEKKVPLQVNTFNDKGVIVVHYVCLRWFDDGHASQPLALVGDNGNGSIPDSARVDTHRGSPGSRPSNRSNMFTPV